MTMNLFSRLRISRRPVAGERHRLLVEELEERTLLATRLVVPVAQPIDNVTTFHDLASAVGAATTVNGDVIQIEAGSTPGGANVNKVLTLQGDFNNGPPSLPALGPLTLAAGGIVLQNLNLGDVTINNGVTGELIRSNTVANVSESSGATTNGLNRLQGNVVTGTVLLGNSPGNSASGDQVIDNVFTNAAAVTLLGFEEDTNAVAQGNTLVDSANGTHAILVLDGQGVVVNGNTIRLAGATSIGITVGSAAATTSVSVLDNRIDTNGQGTGIETAKTAGQTLHVLLANNDLVRNQVGIAVMGDGTANADALGAIDAGGGSLSSQGGNDFHGFTGAAGHFAITTANGVATTDVVFARDNIFSFNNPAALVQAGAGSIDVGMPLAANNAFVDRLFDNFLRRSGRPTDLSMLASVVAARGARRFARQLILSPEALSRLVDVLFLEVLGRPAAPSDEAVWVKVFRRGVPFERVLARFLSSSEFAARANRLASTPGTSDSNFIQGLYVVLLGRIPSTNEIAFWLSIVSDRGRLGTAQLFAGSTEFRAAFVRALYFGDSGLPPTALVTALPNLLHRSSPPLPVELDLLVTTRLSLFEILIRLAGSQEAFVND
jgi:hypothetical protein